MNTERRQPYRHQDAAPSPAMSGILIGLLIIIFLWVNHMTYEDETCASALLCERSAPTVDAQGGH